MNDFKAGLRRQLIARRRAVRGAERAAATKRVALLVGSLPQFKPGARVAVYASFGSELDPAPVIRAAARRGIRLYVPVVMDLARRRMRFVPLSPFVRPGIEVTPGRHARHVTARWFHLILCPVVGIDERGYRLGMGAGFFDRALAFRRLRHHWRGPKLIALAFECQRIDSVHPESWDARLDGVITESGLHHFLQGA
jgi:5-formyltetrahydrofolate cyclo-ligase